MALFSEKMKINPLPPFPKSYADVMKAEIPSNLSKTADGKEFLLLKDWTNGNELESIMVFMSDDRAMTGPNLDDGWHFQVCPGPILPGT